MRGYGAGALEPSGDEEAEGTRRVAPVFAIVLGWAGLNCLWWFWNTAPLAWDQTDYLLTSLEFFDAFRDGGMAKLVHVFLGTTSGYGRPPLLSLFPIPAYGLAGPGTSVAHLALLIFIPLLLLPLYGIGRRMGGEAVGLAACLVAATMPLMVGLSRQYFVEFSLAAVVTGTVYLLFRLWDEEALWLYGGLSAAIAAGMMMKVTYVVFVGPALLVVAAWVIYQRRLRHLVALAAATSLGLALAACWYVPNLHRVLWDIRESGYGIEAVPYGYGGPSLFLWRLAYGGLSIYYTALLVALALKSRWWRVPLWGGVKSARLVLLVLWVAVPLAVFLSAKGRDPRFFVPALPAVALVIGVLLAGRPGNGRARFAFFLFPIAATLVVSFVPLWAFPVAQRPVASRLYQAMGSSFQNPPLGREDWKTEDIVELLWQMSQEGSRPVRTAVLANHPRFHVNLFNYVARLGGKPMTFSVCEDTMKPFSVERCLTQVITGSEFLLDKTGRRRVAGPDRYGTIVDSWMAGGCLPFSPVSVAVSLPDGSSVRLWRKSGVPQVALNSCGVPKALVSRSTGKNSNPFSK